MGDIDLESMANILEVGQKYVPKVACPGEWKHGLEFAVQFLMALF